MTAAPRVISALQAEYFRRPPLHSTTSVKPESGPGSVKERTEEELKETDEVFKSEMGDDY